MATDRSVNLRKKHRYLVHGYYTDEPQVTVDVVDAHTDLEAEALVVHARGGKQSDYQPDGAGLLSTSIKDLQKVAAQSERAIAMALNKIAKEYAHYHEDGDYE